MVQTTIQQNGGFEETFPANSTVFFALFGYPTGGSTATNAEAQVQSKVNATLTAKNLLTTVPTNTLAAASTFRSRKNTANGAMSVSIPGNTTGTFEDTTNSDSLVAGDIYNYSFNSTGFGNFSFGMMSVTFDHSSSATKMHGIAQGGGGNITMAGNAIRFFEMNGWEPVDGAVGITTEATVQFKTEVASTFSRAECFVSANTVTGVSNAILRANGLDKISVAIPASTTGYFENTGTYNAAVGDLINWKWKGGGRRTESMTIQFMAVQEQVSNAGDYHMTSGGNNTPAASSTNYTRSGSYNNYTDFGTGLPNTESIVQLKVRGGPVTAKNLFVRVTAAGAGTHTVRSRKNGANGNLVVSFAATGTFEDTINSDSYVNGDLVNYSITTGSTAPALSYQSSQWIRASEIVVFPSDCSALTPTISVQFSNNTNITVTDSVTLAHDYQLNAVLTDVGSGRGEVESLLKLQGGSATVWIVQPGSNGTPGFGGSGGLHQTNISFNGNFLTDTFTVTFQYLGTDGSGNYLFQLKIVDDTTVQQATFNVTVPRSELGTWTPQNVVGVVGGYNSSCATFSTTSFAIFISSSNTSLKSATLPCGSNNLNCGCANTSNACGVVVLGAEGGNMGYSVTSSTGSQIQLTAST